MACISGVKWHLAVPPEVSTEYAGTRLGDYYSRSDTMIETNRLAREKFLSLYGVDIGGPSVAVPAYVGVTALGADMVLPGDHPPMIVNQGRVLPDRQSVLALEPAYPEDSEWLGKYMRIREEMGAVLGELPPIGAGQEGPITSAVLLRGASFFEDVLDEPEVAHHLLQVVTDTYINFVRYVREVNGAPAQGGVGIADDMAGMLSPALWPEFVVPYWERIYTELGPGKRSVHTELLRPAHLHYLVELGINSYDPGNDQYLTLEDVLAAVGDMYFWWNLFTVRDTKEGTPEFIRSYYEDCVHKGAKGIMTELCRATPRENVLAFVEIARKYE